MSFCLQQNRNWEGRHGRGGWNNVLEKRGGFLSLGETGLGVGVHSWRPRHACLRPRPRCQGGRPRRQAGPADGQQSPMDVFPLITASF